MSLGTYQKGLWAEGLAILYLFLHGYRILHWRYKTRVGEIDLIARRGGTLAFIEVKNRATIEDALLCLTPAMRRRIGQAARQYLATRQGSDKAGEFPETMRYDLIAVAGLTVRHLDNAWADGSY